MQQSKEALGVRGRKSSHQLSVSGLSCNTCRRKKTKCDRSLPSCQSCVRLRHGCVYPKMRLKPGPKASLPKEHVSPRSSQGGVLSTEQGDDAHSPDPERHSKSPANDATLVDPDVISTLGPVEKEINFVRAISLSSIIHPTHETCSPNTVLRPPSTSANSLLDLAGAQDLLFDTCSVLGLSMRRFQYLTDLYFDNMTDLSLFHHPSFGQKVQAIKKPIHLQALFAAMFAFSARFENNFEINGVGDNDGYQTGTTPGADDHIRFHNIALKSIEKCLDECCNGAPSLCVLQAMALVTYTDLIKGVRGRAWRLLGSCVRVAYELHLHLIDFEARLESSKVGRDLTQWVADEERRRCWWGIWKMDNFASTIKRCPTAIDPSMMETYLPVPEDMWFQNQFHQSCFLQREPGLRARALTKSGNESADAWLIVISSIMRDSQVLVQGNLHGVLLEVDSHGLVDEQLLHYLHNSFCKKRAQEDSARLTSLIHSLKTAVSDLPDHLLYQGEHLDFGGGYASAARDTKTARLHSAKYNIYLTTQLAQFMIFHHYAFTEIVSGTSCSSNETPPGPGLSPCSPPPAEIPQGLGRCLEAADNICLLTSQCADDHVERVSPFLSSTVWLSAALQILRNLFVAGIDMGETESKYAILRMACLQYINFWGAPPELLENLDSLEIRLARYHQRSPATADAYHPTGSTPKPTRISGLFTDRSSSNYIPLWEPKQSLQPCGTGQNMSISSVDPDYGPTTPGHCPLNEVGGNATITSSAQHDYRSDHEETTGIPGLDSYHNYFMTEPARESHQSIGGGLGVASRRWADNTTFNYELGYKLSERLLDFM